ncbi:hypothetical protein DSO57_1026734 [Entomophthora muscae]|uniref:Uncharacterized protein n=1 Tax=Entomophthora muscae TaxID=34485 RepID=A0ACC2UML6_9FUNG|nr:hypothetical protein DSO57_1026734 [Entomophthora muscae]
MHNPFFPQPLVDPLAVFLQTFGYLFEGYGVDYFTWQAKHSYDGPEIYTYIDLLSNFPIQNPKLIDEAIHAAIQCYTCPPSPAKVILETALEALTYYNMQLLQ